jgi:hypothetical protein
MEMPIRIMITLFVAIVVGSTIIVFSKQMIDQSKEDLNKNRPGYNPDAVEEQKIISLVKVDTAQLTALIQECYNKNHGKTFERELCFVVTGKTADWRWADVETHVQATDMDAGVNITDDLADESYAVNIYFDPYGDQETIWLSR